MTKRGYYVVIAGGEEPKGKALQFIQEADYIICADSGADFCYKNKIVPQRIIGDLDSISSEAINWFTTQNVKFSVYPKEKDYTDTDLALNWCIEQNADQIVLVGALGK